MAKQGKKGSAKLLKEPASKKPDQTVPPASHEQLTEESASKKPFGLEDIVELNKDLSESTITLYLPPDFDKAFLPVKAKALRSWWEEDDKTRMHARFCLPLTMASGLGYYILSPATFTIEWDGDIRHDVTVNIIDGASHAVIDNHSAHGAFTVQARFIPRTKSVGDFVIVKGVANHIRYPFHVLEAMMEAWWSPSEFGIVCLMNQAGKFTVRKGEPLAQMFVVNAQQAQYSLAAKEGYPAHWDEWTEKRKPPDYNGRNMDYLRGVWPDQTPVCPHFKNWSAVAETHETPSELSVSDYWSAGDAAKLSGNLDEAMRQYTKAIHFAENRNQVTEKFLDSVYLLGRQLLESDQFEFSKNILQKCVILNERIFRSTSGLTTSLLGDMGYVYRMCGELESAVKTFKEALRLKKLDATNPLSMARTMIDLGTLYDFKGQHEEAEPLLKAAQKIYQTHLEPDDPHYVYSTNVMACLLDHQGKTQEAKKLFDDVMAKKTRLFGADSLEIAFTHIDLGFHFKALKLYEEAEKNFNAALLIRQKKLGDTDLEVAAIHEHLGYLHLDSGELDKAKTDFLELMAIRQQKLSPNDPLLKATCNALGHFYTQAGEDRLAEHYFGRAR